MARIPTELTILEKSNGRIIYVGKLKTFAVWTFVSRNFIIIINTTILSLQRTLIKTLYNGSKPIFQLWEEFS